MPRICKTTMPALHSAHFPALFLTSLKKRQLCSPRTTVLASLLAVPTQFAFKASGLRLQVHKIHASHVILQSAPLSIKYSFYSSPLQEGRGNWWLLWFFSFVFFCFCFLSALALDLPVWLQDSCLIVGFLFFTKG